MSAGQKRAIDNLKTGILHVSGKVRGRLLKHAHHDYDVRAAIYAWNNPNELSFVKPSKLGEGKDMTDPKIILISARRKKGVSLGIIFID